jgi:transcriptional regulator with XRE-family HTH domain
MKRKPDGVIDKKIGSVIRIRRIKLGMSQGELDKALGVTFQQIQKYENGANAIASTRIPDLCKILEMTPNDLFGGFGTSAAVSTSILTFDAASPSPRTFELIAHVQ